MYFRKNRHPAEPLLKQYKILNFEKQNILASACFMWSVGKKRGPKCYY